MFLEGLRLILRHRKALSIEPDQIAHKCVASRSSRYGFAWFAMNRCNDPLRRTERVTLIGLTKTAAMEYAGHNIRINAVGPAFIDTPLLTKNLDAETIGHLTTVHPTGRLGTPEEVSALTCFLLSANASFITGSHHLVDGGYTAK